MIKRLSLLLVLISFVPSLAISGNLTQIEKRRVEADATDAFNRIIDFWKARKCADLYECGYRKSQASIPRENFMNKMQNKSYEMALSWETIQDVEVEVVSKKLVNVRAKIGYRKKGSVGGETKFLTDTYRMVFEDDRWRVDLSRIMRCPF